jgi:hypothetical protein
MSETWKLWEGRTVDGKSPLQSYLGGSGQGWHTVQVEGWDNQGRTGNHSTLSQ